MNHELSLSALENWLWQAACAIRGPIDAPKFKDYILPLIFLKRLCDVFEDELDELAHKGQVLLVNASQQFAKGRPKNYLAEEHVERLAAAYLDWRQEEGLSRIIATQEAVRTDYNLSPSRYVALGGGEEVLPLEEALVVLAEAEAERRAADAELSRVLASLGLRW